MTNIKLSSTIRIPIKVISAHIPGGVRYNQRLIKDLSRMVCAPSDIITPKLQRELAVKHLKVVLSTFTLSEMRKVHCHTQLPGDI